MHKKYFVKLAENCRMRTLLNFAFLYLTWFTYYCLKFSFANSFFSGYTQTRKRRKSEEKFWEESLYAGVLFRSWGHGKKWMKLFINWEVFQRSYCLKYTKKKQNKHTLFREKLVLSFLQEPKCFRSGLHEKIGSLSHEPR